MASKRRVSMIFSRAGKSARIDNKFLKTLVQNKSIDLQPIYKFSLHQIIYLFLLS